MTKRFGFTLAEVLITLGIIGVVAAMTMPTLINSTQGAQYKAAFKKALSALSQAVTLNVALDEWDFGDITGTGDYTMTNLLTSRMNVVRTETAALDADEYTIQNTGTNTVTNGANTTLFMNDGIMFQFPATIGQTTACTKDTTASGVTAWDATRQKACSGFVDVNGTKGPNKVVVCDGKTTGTDANCKVTNPTDIYPVMFYGQTIVPATAAGRAVLYAK